ncbi:hypothetical protein M0R45_008520 [Rubus argutus]|uniref:Cyclic nucleotide-binding domain-containing protein n=1 Tax=Rubus argutus TaxID=59490 RepID=A0AAW1Y2D4_RUBAR
MQAVGKSSRILQKMNIIKPKITFMVSEYGLENDRVGMIEEDIQQILEDDENFVVQNIFSVLQPTLQGGIKWYLCNREMLRKDFNVLSALLLHGKYNIIEYVEQVSYTGGSYIIRKGEPLDMIFFIALGNVVTYSTKYDGSSGSSTTIELKKFQWYGVKDLIPWAVRSSSNLSNLPLSTITIKSHKQVDIFAIKATDLKNIASEFPEILNMEVHHSTDSTGQMEIVKWR